MIEMNDGGVMCVWLAGFLLFFLWYRPRTIPGGEARRLCSLGIVGTSALLALKCLLK